jgi:hypothetical protein
MSTAIELTVRQFLEIYRALNSLDAVRSGKDELIALEFTGVTRAKLMANSQALEPMRLAHEAADRALAAQHGVHQGMGESPENASKVDAYKRAVEDALDLKCEVGLHRIALTALLNRLGDGKTIRTNPVPQSLLNRLAPILDFNADE